MVETNIPNYFPFNKITPGFKKKPEIDLNKIVAVMASVKKLVDSFEKDTLVLNKKEKLISNMLEYTKNSINSELNNLQQKELEMIYIEEEINNIEDIIKIIDIYRNKDHNTYKFSINMDILRDLYDSLHKLQSTIGMKDVKSQIVDQIVSSIQGLYDDEQMFHTVIQGVPGVGKTMLAHIIGEIYSKLGVINKKDFIFRVATRSDLIGKYLGHTAKLTQTFIDSCKGGVMFIDEVYSLGNSEGRDTFSKECIDTINLNLTKNKDFVCIIAGYPEEVDNCFFSYNQGLQRRFPFRYTISKYSPEEMKDIFLLKIKNIKWSTNINEDIITDFFDRNKDSFKHYGGDIQNLITNIKTVHGRRVFGKKEELKLITKEDLDKGFEKYSSFKNKKKEENNILIIF